MKVGELIALLQKEDPETEVSLSDPDTGWHLRLIYVGRDVITYLPVPFQDTSPPLPVIVVSGDYGSKLE